MNRKKRQAVTYIWMPLLFTVLGYAVLYVVGMPLINLLDSQVRMIITKGAPSYSNEYDPEVSKLNIQQEGTFHMSDILVPDLETHYGNITCENIGLDAPVYYGDSEEVLKNGVGQYIGSGLPGEGKPILIGGHDSTYFAVLEQVKDEDIVRIATNYGEFEYRVRDMQIKDTADTTAYDLDQNEEQLILYTCYPFGQLIGDRSKRFYVYCDRISENNTVEE